MKIIILIAYLITGIATALYELVEFRKFKKRYPTYPEEFALLNFIMVIVFWPFIVVSNIKL